MKKNMKKIISSRTSQRVHALRPMFQKVTSDSLNDQTMETIIRNFFPANARRLDWLANAMIHVYKSTVTDRSDHEYRAFRHDVDQYGIKTAYMLDTFPTLPPAERTKEISDEKWAEIDALKEKCHDYLCKKMVKYLTQRGLQISIGQAPVASITRARTMFSSSHGQYGVQSIIAMFRVLLKKSNVEAGSYRAMTGDDPVVPPFLVGRDTPPQGFSSTTRMYHPLNPFSPDSLPTVSRDVLAGQWGYEPSTWRESEELVRLLKQADPYEVSRSSHLISRAHETHSANFASFIQERGPSSMVSLDKSSNLVLLARVYQFAVKHPGSDLSHLNLSLLTHDNAIGRTNRESIQHFQDGLFRLQIPLVMTDFSKCLSEDTTPFSYWLESQLTYAYMLSFVHKHLHFKNESSKEKLCLSLAKQHLLKSAEMFGLKNPNDILRLYMLAHHTLEEHGNARQKPLLNPATSFFKQAIKIYTSSAWEPTNGPLEALPESNFKFPPKPQPEKPQVPSGPDAAGTAPAQDHDQTRVQVQAQPQAQTQAANIPESDLNVEANDLTPEADLTFEVINNMPTKRGYNLYSGSHYWRCFVLANAENTYIDDETKMHVSVANTRLNHLRACELVIRVVERYKIKSFKFLQQTDRAEEDNNLLATPSNISGKQFVIYFTGKEEARLAPQIAADIHRLLTQHDITPGVTSLGDTQVPGNSYCWFRCATGVFGGYVSAQAYRKQGFTGLEAAYGSSNTMTEIWPQPAHQIPGFVESSDLLQKAPQDLKDSIEEQLMAHCFGPKNESKFWTMTSAFGFPSFRGADGLDIYGHRFYSQTPSMRPLMLYAPHMFTLIDNGINAIIHSPRDPFDGSFVKEGEQFRAIISAAADKIARILHHKGYDSGFTIAKITPAIYHAIFIPLRETILNAIPGYRDVPGQEFQDAIAFINTYFRTHKHDIANRIAECALRDSMVHQILNDTPVYIPMLRQGIRLDVDAMLSETFPVSRGDGHPPTPEETKQLYMAWMFLHTVNMKLCFSDQYLSLNKKADLASTDTAKTKQEALKILRTQIEKHSPENKRRILDILVANGYISDRTRTTLLT